MYNLRDCVGGAKCTNYILFYINIIRVCSGIGPAAGYGNNILLLKWSQCENVPKADQSCIPEHPH